MIISLNINIISFNIPYKSTHKDLNLNPYYIRDKI